MVSTKVGQWFLALVFIGLGGAALSGQETGESRRADVIGPGDVLRLRIWREPDMSGDFAVNASGRVVLPLLGEMSVDSLPASSLQGKLTEKYRVYLNNPSIEVVVLRRVTVTGAVRNPGVYPLEPTMSISDAIALAGGPAPDGKRDRVEVRRAGHRIMADLRNDVVIADTPVQSGDQLYVPSRAWLSRNTWLISAGVTLAAVIVRQSSR